MHPFKFMTELDITGNKLEEMRKQFPALEVVEEQDKEIGFLHSGRVFLYEGKYADFNAKFYADITPACFLRAEVYKDNQFQYFIGTWSGEWKKNLKMLENVVGEISKKGLDAVKHKLNGNRLGIHYRQF
jgi:hypothetical protein